MEKRLKIATYNVVSMRRYPDYSWESVDPSYCGEVIKEFMPDILGLNEVSSGDFLGKQPDGLAELLGYKYHYFAHITSFSDEKYGERDYGDALLSRYPIKSAELIRIPDPDVKDEDVYYETRGIIKAEIDVLGGLTVLVTHFGLAKSEQKNAVETLMKLIDENPEKTILMGDFNITPDNEFLIPIKERLNDTAAGYSYDEKSLYTFISDNPYQKIDYIFVSKDFKTESISVSEKIGSDHRMIKAEISL